MGRRSEDDGRLWWLVTTTIIGLLVAIAVVGVVGIAVNQRVRAATERALLFDVELEDEGDDLRVAVLDLRHYHRNIWFGGPSDAAMADLDRAYHALLEEIGELELLDVSDLLIMQPQEMRERATRYYDEFRAAITRTASDPERFSIVNDEGLRQIAELEQAAEQIDEQGEVLTENSLIRVNRETTFARIVLLTLLVGIVVVGIAVAVAASRVVRRIRVSYAREQASAQELARALRTKTDFIADASHELRTPLTVIRGNADIGLTTPDSAAQQAILKDIAAEAVRMSRLVDDLLFLARSDAGVPPLEREYVPARWLVGQVVKSADVLTQQRASCLTTTIAVDGLLEVDPARVLRAVMVLVDNAAKHGTSEACTSLSALTKNHHLEITVADRGPGIPAGDLPLIFDRFYQVGNRRGRRKDGSGLGLAIAKTIVEAHGGTLAVDSTPKHGTRFTIRLPCGLESEASTVPSRALVNAAAETGAASD
ncbi:MAG: HAMP domain-containing histidine kinase [Chloroflexota bacterium]|nr:HAMP domain-containing histidine kinase [Chloroflexota bacterium]